MKNFLLQIDRFGQQINLNYKGQPFFQTGLGGLFTLLLIGLFTTAIYFFGKEIFVRQNPTTIFSTEFKEKPLEYQISDKSFPFAVGLQDGNTSIYYLDERIYTVKMVNQIRLRLLNESTGQYYVKQQEIPIPTGPCTLEDLSGNNDTINYFSKLNYNQMYCIKHNQLQFQTFIQGTFVNEVYKTITIRFFPCQNTSESQKCLPQENITNKLSAGYAQIVFVDLLVDPRDPNKVFKYNGRDTFTFVSINNYKNIQFYLKHVGVETDIGWIFEDIVQENGAAFANVFELADPRPKAFFLQMQIRVFTQIEKYQRAYKKVQNVLAEIGGLLQSLLVIIGFFLIPISKLKFYKSLINQLYVFKNSKNSYQNQMTEFEGEGEMQLLSPTKNQILQINSDKGQVNSRFAAAAKLIQGNKKKKGRGQSFLVQSYKHVVESNVQRNQEKKKTLTEILQDKKKQMEVTDAQFQVQQGGFKLKYYEYIMFYLCPCGRMKKKREHLYQAISKIEERLDPVYILNKLNELDKLKMLLLKPNQLRLFDYLPRPVINFEQQQSHFQKNAQQVEYWSILQQKQTHYEKAFQAFMAYQQIMEGKQDALDNKLLDLMEPTIKSVFVKAYQKVKPIQSIKSIQEKDGENSINNDYSQIKNEDITNLKNDEVVNNNNDQQQQQRIQLQKVEDQNLVIIASSSDICIESPPYEVKSRKNSIQSKYFAE